jgi:hypothetical protein
MNQIPTAIIIWVLAGEEMIKNFKPKKSAQLDIFKEDILE